MSTLMGQCAPVGSEDRLAVRAAAVAWGPMRDAFANGIYLLRWWRCGDGVQRLVWTTGSCYCADGRTIVYGRGLLTGLNLSWTIEGRGARPAEIGHPDPTWEVCEDLTGLTEPDVRGDMPYDAAVACHPVAAAVAALCHANEHLPVDTEFSAFVARRSARERWARFAIPLFAENVADFGDASVRDHDDGPPRYRRPSGPMTAVKRALREEYDRGLYSDGERSAPKMTFEQALVRSGWAAALPELPALVADAKATFERRKAGERKGQMALLDVRTVARGPAK